MAAEILGAHAEHISWLTIIPGAGGIFVITAGEQRVYSKQETGRFPQPGEAARLVAARL